MKIVSRDDHFSDSITPLFDVIYKEVSSPPCTHFAKASAISLASYSVLSPTSVLCVLQARLLGMVNLRR